MSLTFRRAAEAEIVELAGMRWRYLTEERGHEGTDREGFVRHLRDWAAARTHTHLPFVAADRGELVGGAWLAIVERVPSPRSPIRRTGDLQAVYIVPGARDAGVGAALLAEVLAEARRRDLERVTVHSSTRAIPFYRRHGFTGHDSEMSWRPAEA
jgi:GNAT superfamily N-acetyltransferase